MNVLFVTPECAPLTKTGGLGDVSAALPAALRATGVDVRTLMPRYSAAMTGVPIARLHLLGSDCQVLEADAMLLLDCPDLYLRDGGPYQTHDGDDWEDNALRFGVLSRAAALLGTPASPLSWQPQVVHCHDWPTALAPAYLHFEERRAATVMTIHNLAFQGNFDAALLEPLGLPHSSFHMDGVEFHGRLSLLKAGIAYADAVTTVSPSYAREIQGEALGCGLDGLLRRRREALTGIANGIDVETWNPATDPRIAQPYDAQSLEAKAANKAALQQRMGLRQDEDLPLLGMVSRLTQQKGADLVAAAAGERCERADVAPVAALLEILHTGDLVVGEIIGVYARLSAQPRQHVAPEVGLVSLARLAERVFQHVRLEKVVPHRSVRARCIVRQRRRVLRLFAELAHPPVRLRRDYAEGRGALQRYGDRRHRGIGLLRAVKRNHLPHVHAVHMVGGEHCDQVRRVGVHRVEALVDRVRRAAERQAIGPRQQGPDHAFAVLEPRRPRRLDVAHQRVGLVLRHDIDGGDSGVDEVAQHEIDDTVAAGERQRRLGVLGSQGVEPRSFAAGEHQGNYVHEFASFLFVGDSLGISCWWRSW